MTVIDELKVTFTLTLSLNLLVKLI